MKALLSVFAVVLGALGITSVTHAGVDDFVIASYDIHYTLSRDAENRSLLTTDEKIVAQFPDFDQNHGIERAIPTSYDGHSTSLSVRSVVDENGNSLNYTTYDSNSNTVVRIGDKDTYVHGTHTYVITYIQRDVTKFFQNTGKTEFYWDTNGTEWRVPINSLHVSLALDPSITSSFTGNSSCYFGGVGST